MNKNMNYRNNLSFNRFGSLAVLVAGGYFAWQNRFKIQRFLESYGIRTPWLNDNVSDTVRSGISKVAGKIDRETGNRPGDQSIEHKTSRAV